VGDNARDDVVGGSAAGMGAVLLHRHPEWRAAPALPAATCILRDLEAADLLVPGARGPAAPAERRARAFTQA
jgi:FMN phosphatase YigB (HAD superfamily)